MINRKMAMSEHASKNVNIQSRQLPTTFWFMAMAVMVGVGYLAGIYHYQIEAAIGPVFGYKAHSGYIDLSSVQKTYNTLAANYDGKLDLNLLIHGANRGLVEAAGDDYTTYLSPKEAMEYSDSLSGKIGGGIGAEIGVKDTQVTIIRTLKGYPAEKAGLIANDKVLAVNDESTVGMTVDEAVSRIRGEEGTTVKLKIQRKNEIKEYSIMREIINAPSVDSKVDGKFGILTISRFDGEETANMAREAAEEFKSQGVEGVVLDLRGNPGGHVSAAVDVAGLWLNNKIVLTEKSDGIVNETRVTNDEAVLAGVPTVVLINGGSASASEILAGALQDHNVAKLVGEKTFGKGSVQQLIPLGNGAELKVTIGRWFTPKNNNITKNGIKPDVVVELTQDHIDKSVDPQLDMAKKLLVS